ncbi:hypothetical protein [Treponema sp.]|uniref:hypothetical protein n=1 Tax=Treponema sp. TaxID=166 RepID=UPI00298DC5CC|nr:hypothetical protein [Treponema sp.]MCQ2240307.1 hypothetical protein [Treponema sp.]
MKTTEEEKQKFIKAFEEEFEDKVISFELAELRASSVVFNLLKLKPEQNENSMWGLVVFCEGGTYFYSFPQDSLLSLYVRKTTGMNEQMPQCISLSGIRCRFRVPETTFFDFVIPRRKHIVKVYFFDENKISHSFELLMNKKAADVIGLFPTY